MNKNLIIAFALVLFAVSIPATLCAIDVGDIAYGGACNSAYLTISSGTITIALDDVKDFNLTYSGTTADAVTLTTNATYTILTRANVSAFDIVANSGSTVTLDINSTHVKLTNDGNSTNTTYNATAAAYNTVGKLVAAIDARSDYNCSLLTGAGTYVSAVATTDLNEITSQDITSDYNVAFSTVDALNNSATDYDTVGEIFTALSAMDDLTLVAWDYTASVNSTAINDVSAQDITTLYTVLDTQSNTYTVATYDTFGKLEAALETTTEMTFTPKTGVVGQKYSSLGTLTLDDESKSTIEATAVTISAGGTIYDTHAPYVKATGTLDDVLFCLQLYNPRTWYLPYVKSDGTEAIAVWSG
jgi:hypothetical protein